MSAALFTVLVSCSIELAVCCRLLALCSVRVDRSLVPLAISVDAVSMASTAERTSPMVWASRVCIVSSAPSVCETSSLPPRATRLLRSPSAMCCVSDIASARRRVMPRASSVASTVPTTSASTPAVTMPISVWRREAWISASTAARPASAAAVSSSSAAIHCCCTGHSLPVSVSAAISGCIVRASASACFISGAAAASAPSALSRADFSAAVRPSASSCSRLSA